VRGNGRALGGQQRGGLERVSLSSFQKKCNEAPKKKKGFVMAMVNTPEVREVEGSPFRFKKRSLSLVGSGTVRCQGE